jgi:hypothetical protein
MSERQARYLVRKAPHVGGRPIPEDEPLLVVRAQDHLCLPTLDFYIDRYMAHLRQLETPTKRGGTTATAAPSVVLGAHEVLEELVLHRRAIVAWQTEPGRLIKWADR